MADADPTWKNSTPDSPAAGELPPNYESLFPEGPPKSLSDPATVPSAGTQPTAPAIESSQQEQTPNSAMAPLAVAES